VDVTFQEVFAFVGGSVTNVAVVDMDLFDQISRFQEVEVCLENCEVKVGLVNYCGLGNA